MKHTTLSIFVFYFSIITLHAAVPLRWTVETSRLAPAVFDVVRGETIALEAAFNSAGKPFAMDGEPVSVFWQTNGMGNAWWTAPAVATSNLVRATFTPEMDPGAATVNGFLGSSGSIYRAAFTFRFRHGPGAVPNTLPLPVPVIDFAKVRVLNPPWSGGGGGGVDTNAVRDIIREQLATNGIRSVDGEARPLPKYLHALDFCDGYPDAAQEYYLSRGDGKTDGGCSSVRSGGFMSRNFDYPFDERAEFIVKMSAGTVPAASSPRGVDEHRFASVGISQVGTNLTEAIATSGKPSRCYKWLPGATVDGINENGVVCEINVVDGTPPASTGGDIHPLAAVRWALDNGTSAGMVASNLAARIAFPAGWTQNFHWMVADERETWVVENGNTGVYGSPDSPAVLTNFKTYPQREYGMGWERYFKLKEDGSNITNAWYTNAYRRETNPPWVSDLADVLAYTNAIFNAWATHPKEYFRGKTNNGITWWQTVHTSVYDITNRTLRVAVQEVDDWYTFAVPSAGGMKPDAVREIVEPMIGAATNGLRRVDDMAVYKMVGYGRWSHGEPPAGMVLEDQPTWVEGKWRWRGTRGILFVATLADPEGTASEGTFVFDFNQGEFTATRATKLGPTSDRLATTNGVAQAIAEKRDKTDLTYDDYWSIALRPNSTSLYDGSIAKFDMYGNLTGARPGIDYIVTHQDISGKQDKITVSGILKGDGEGVVSTASGSLEGGANADYRNPKDNTCYRTEFRFYASGVPSGVTLKDQPIEDVPDYYIWEDEDGIFWDQYEVVGQVYTFKCGFGPHNGETFTATRSAVCTSNELFTTPSYVDGKVSAAVSTNNPDFVSAVRAIMPTTLRAYDPVRQCWWNIQPVNGVLTLTVED